MDPQPEPPKETVDWDTYLGPAAWRPFNSKHLDGFNFEKGGGLVGVEFSNGLALRGPLPVWQSAPMAKLRSSITRSRTNNCAQSIRTVSS